MTKRPPRRGSSITELLVVIAIVAVLISLLLPAVQKMREAAARTQCVHNLHQLGLALHNYHDVQNRLPPGVVSGPPFPFMSWNTRLLPFIEQPALWAQAQQAYAQTSVFGRDPPHPLTVVVSLYSCPSDPRTRAPGKYAAFTSYLGVEGTNQFRHDGVLFMDSQVRLTDITDGTSNTLMVGERPPSADQVLGWWYAGWGQNRDGSAEMVLGALERNFGMYGGGCPPGPYSYGPGRLTGQCDVFHFWSPHVGGANFLFADGSTHFLTYSAVSVLPALATRAGGEAVTVPN